MARTLHEDVAGVDFFIPTLYDKYSVVATGSQNTDPSFRISPSTDNRAYVPVPTLTPNIFKQRSYGWSFSTWLRPGGSGSSFDLFRLENDLNNGTLGINNPFKLSVSWNGSFGRTGLSLSYYGASGTQTWFRESNANNSWTFYAFMMPAAGQVATSIFGRADSGATGIDATLTTHGTVAGGTDTYASDLKACFGRYSDNVAVGQSFVNYDLSKFTFHNHVLTLTECHMLYQSMV